MAPAAADHSDGPLVTPTLVEGNDECDWKVDPPNAGLHIFGDQGQFQVTITRDGDTFGFTTNLPVETVVAKGGPDHHLYDYTGLNVTHDSGLHAPFNPPPEDKVFGLSHISFCFEEPPTPEQSVTIIKNTVGGNSTFDFESDLPGGDFDIETAGGTGQHGPIAVDPGDFEVTEVDLPAGWTLTSIVCSNDSEIDLDEATAFIEVDVNEHVTCTFTNTLPPPGGNGGNGGNGDDPVVEAEVIEEEPEVEVLAEVLDEEEVRPTAIPAGSGGLLPSGSATGLAALLLAGLALTFGGLRLNRSRS